jgi:CO dehydrogenase/acetyl-CoA synthase beta subunit
MPSNKDQPKEIESEFVSRASEELEDAVADELEVEDPSVEEAAAIIAELSVEMPVVEEAVSEEEEEEEVEEEAAAQEPDSDDPPVRVRGPQ